MFWRRSRGGEFHKTWFGAESREGFRVELRSKNWIDHIEGGTRRRAFAEMMGLKRGFIIHKNVSEAEGFAGLDPQQSDRIYAGIVRALHFLGYETDLME